MKKVVTAPEYAPGQHMHVVPGPVRQANAAHPLLKGLMVTDAGFFSRIEGHYVERPKGTETHLFIACQRGSGWVTTLEGKHAMKAGELVWLPAGQAHAYGAQSGDPWTITWAHFMGDEIPAWRALLGWAAGEYGGFGRVSAEQISELKMDEVYRELQEGYDLSRLVAAAATLRMTWLAAARLGTLAGATRSAAERVAAVEARLRRDYARAYRLDELATAAGLSVPHFSDLFRRQTGYAPIDFLLRTRIRKACALLDGSDAPVKQVAAQVGIEDPFYFTRCFGRVMGCSPQAYRGIQKG
jgi:AraC-like DNA-binding protein